MLAAIAGYQDGIAWLADPGMVSVPAVPAVHGYAIGAGFRLAPTCDLRVVADDVRSCMTEPAPGLVPEVGGTKPLVALVWSSWGLEICATARYVEADEARQRAWPPRSCRGPSSRPPPRTWWRPSSTATRFRELVGGA